MEISVHNVSANIFMISPAFRYTKKIAEILKKVNVILDILVIKILKKVCKKQNYSFRANACIKVLVKVKFVITIILMNNFINIAIVTLNNNLK